MIRRHFTVEEADSLIPMLEPVMRDLQRLVEQLRAAGEELETFEQRVSLNGAGEGWSGAAPDLKGVRKDVEERLLYLQGVGVQVKDLEHGILDFPTRMEGRDVCLCWRLGETEVGYWHEMDTGYAGRTPL
jgi:hypothetical protein